MSAASSMTIRPTGEPPASMSKKTLGLAMARDRTTGRGRFPSPSAWSTPEVRGERAVVVGDPRVAPRATVHSSGRWRKAMTDAVLLTHVADGVATLTLNRPQALNALDRDLTL